jgi:radical SAM-linked protein
VATPTQRAGAAADKWRSWRPAVPQHFDYRFEFAKRGRIRHLSQRELGELLLNACQQVGLEVATTGLAQPKPKIGFGPPLAAGVSGLREIVDLSFRHKHPEPIAAISDRLPKGFVLRRARFVPGGIGRTALDRIVRADYAVRLPQEFLTRIGLDAVRGQVAALSQRPAAGCTNASDPISQIQSLALVASRERGDAHLSFSLDLRGNGKRIRPREVLERVLKDPGLDLNILRLRRTQLWAQMPDSGELVTPLALIDRHLSRLRATARRCA